MSRGIPDQVIDEIRQSIDLVELASEYLKLERRGKNMVGLCPFHTEKTPSFTISPEKQLFHCFGCNASGNVFSFVMDMEKLTFPEAVKILAKRTGVHVPDERNKFDKADNLKENLYKANRFAARYYHHLLVKSNIGKIALDYLLKRGINRETIETFMIGYAPDSWTALVDFARKKGANVNYLVQTGLLTSGKDKGFYDRFRNRIMFPIMNLSDEVTGFGGRLIEDKGSNGPKYLNSPETMVFGKGRILYGLNLARKSIRSEDKAIIMEGYTDVIAVYQAGIKNVVASLGTALTDEQARLIRTQSENVVTVFDADSAGESATWRGLVILQNSGCLVQVADLPEDSDPDSYIREHGPDSFKLLLEEAEPLVEYRLSKLRKRFNLKTEKGRKGYLEEILSFITMVSDQVEQDYYLKKAAEELGVNESSLRSELDKKNKLKGKRNRAKETPVSDNKSSDRITLAEKYIIALLLQNKEIVDIGRNLLKQDYFGEERIKRIVEEIFNYWVSESVVTIERLLNIFDDEQDRNIVTGAATDPFLQDLDQKTANKIFIDSIKVLHEMWIEKQLNEMQRELGELEAKGLQEKANQLNAAISKFLVENKDGYIYHLEEGGDFDS